MPKLIVIGTASSANSVSISLRSRSATMNASRSSVSGRIERELLAAHARGGIDRPLAAFEQPRDADEHGIADVMAGTVVDLLEMVEVADHHGQTRPRRRARSSSRSSSSRKPRRFGRSVSGSVRAVS